MSHRRPPRIDRLWDALLRKRSLATDREWMSTSVILDPPSRVLNRRNRYQSTGGDRLRLRNLLVPKVEQDRNYRGSKPFSCPGNRSSVGVANDPTPVADLTEWAEICPDNLREERAVLVLFSVI